MPIYIQIFTDFLNFLLTNDWIIYLIAYTFVFCLILWLIRLSK